jgi:hypothetical protein
VYVARQRPQTTPALVLVHGAPDRSATFRDVLSYLADRRVVVYDRRGYGRSLHTPPARAKIDHANDLLAILEDCQAPPAVVAHSFGSTSRCTLPHAARVPLPPSDCGNRHSHGSHGGPSAPRRATPGSRHRTNRPTTSRRCAAGFSATRCGTTSRPKSKPSAALRARPSRSDMASELDAPFDFQDVFVPALVGYGTATSADHSEGARWLADSSRTPGCMRVPGPVTSPPAPTPGSSQPSRASSPNWPRNTRRIPATRQVRHENRDVIAPGPGAA